MDERNNLQLPAQPTNNRRSDHRNEFKFSFNTVDQFDNELIIHHGLSNELINSHNYGSIDHSDKLINNCDHPDEFDNSNHDRNDNFFVHTKHNASHVVFHHYSVSDRFVNSDSDKFDRCEYDCDYAFFNKHNANNAGHVIDRGYNQSWREKRSGRHSVRVAGGKSDSVADLYNKGKPHLHLHRTHSRNLHSHGADECEIATKQDRDIATQRTVNLQLLTLKPP